ncbi:YidC/Oxa1 family membrane protein insertase [Aquirhabdus sp.]|uniref:YidC/Oxa1 family membrane protein insertase n=1 Tax=Aquirhabdus sp. TaxID=2824160 RepID=UPI00396C6F68
MEFWTAWTHILETSLSYLSANWGLSEAFSIITLTLIVRFALMPVSLAAAYKMQKNKEAMKRIKPELEEIKRNFKDNRPERTNKTMALYQKHSISIVDKVSIFNLSTQGLFGIGIFHVLKHMMFRSKFLWIATLAKPDILLTILVGSLMMFGMVLMPNGPENMSMWLVLMIPVAISVFAIIALPAALGVYWATSNAVTVLQMLILRGIVTRQIPTI